MELESSERYDRQIRLWGQDGQSKFSNSKVCLINCDSLGLEILRGLCLAGVGSFTIMDSHRLSAEDVGCSFLPFSSIGKGRGESARAVLIEMNAEVPGEVFPLETYLPHVTTTPQSNLTTQKEEDDSINKDLELWKRFSCVIVCGTLYTGQIRRLGKLCWSLNIPLVLCKALGFYGSIRLQVKEHFVADTHPEWKPAKQDPNKPDILNICNTESIRDEYDGKVFNYIHADNGDDLTAVYVCLKALDLFFSTYGRLPGLRDEQVEADVGKLKDCVKQMFGKSTSQLELLDQCLYEVCRYGGAEIHATSAFVGGCAAQEIIKLITSQYVPLDDVMVYSAMSATTKSFKFNQLFAQS